MWLSRSGRLGCLLSNKPNAISSSWRLLSSSFDDPQQENLVQSLHDKIICGNRGALSRAITLSESSRKDHRDIAQKLLISLLPKRPSSVLRIGISGPPGAGKSTFIEAFGNYITKNTESKVSVLAIDPSSVITGGSILGDKTRMQELSNNPSVFIRPSPSRGVLGGIAQHTNEAILFCEAAGYDICLVETVGVGQSETAIVEVCDLILLLVPPAGGDELQGLKKGIIEIADIIIVNKADGALKDVARHSKAEYQRALQLVRPRMPEIWKPKVLMCSSVSHDGIQTAWEEISKFRSIAEKKGVLAEKRRKQRQKWLWREVQAQLVHKLNEDREKSTSFQQKVDALEHQVDLDLWTPRAAATSITEAFLNIESRIRGEHVEKNV